MRPSIDRKTTAAVQLSFKAWENGISVIWVQGGSEEAFLLTMGQAARDACLLSQPQDMDKRILLSSFKKWLDSPRSAEWLIVVDNLIELDSIPLANWDLMPQQRGRIIFTTRAAHIDCHEKYGLRGVDCVKVDKMSTGEALRLFHIFTNDETLGSFESVNGILEILGCFPLAIVQAGSLIKKSKISSDKYVELLGNQRSKEELLRESINARTSSEPASSRAVFTTWNITMDIIKRESEHSVHLLQILSYFDSEGIPDGVVAAASRALGMSDLNTIKAREVLCNYGFLQVKIHQNGTTVQWHIHPLVCFWTRQLIEESSLPWIVTKLILTFLETRDENLSFEEDLLPQFTAALSLLRPSNGQGTPTFFTISAMPIAYKFAEAVRSEALESPFLSSEIFPFLENWLIHMLDSSANLHGKETSETLGMGLNLLNYLPLEYLQSSRNSGKLTNGVGKSDDIRNYRYLRGCFETCTKVLGCDHSITLGFRRHLQHRGISKVIFLPGRAAKCKYLRSLSLMYEGRRNNSTDKAMDLAMDAICGYMDMLQNASDYSTQHRQVYREQSSFTKALQHLSQLQRKIELLYTLEKGYRLCDVDRRHPITLLIVVIYEFTGLYLEDMSELRVSLPKDQHDRLWVPKASRLREAHGSDLHSPPEGAQLWEPSLHINHSKFITAELGRYKVKLIEKYGLLVHSLSSSLSSVLKTEGAVLRIRKAHPFKWDPVRFYKDIIQPVLERFRQEGIMPELSKGAQHRYREHEQELGKLTLEFEELCRKHIQNQAPKKNQLGEPQQLLIREEAIRFEIGRLQSKLDDIIYGYIRQLGVLSQEKKDLETMDTDIAELQLRSQLRIPELDKLRTDLQLILKIIGTEIRNTCKGLQAAKEQRERRHLETDQLFGVSYDYVAVTENRVWTDEQTLPKKDAFLKQLRGWQDTSESTARENGVVVAVEWSDSLRRDKREKIQNLDRQIREMQKSSSGVREEMVSGAQPAESVQSRGEGYSEQGPAENSADDEGNTGGSRSQSADVSESAKTSWKGRDQKRASNRKSAGAEYMVGSNASSKSVRGDTRKLRRSGLDARPQLFSDNASSSHMDQKGSESITQKSMPNSERIKPVRLCIRLSGISELKMANLTWRVSQRLAGKEIPEDSESEGLCCCSCKIQ